MTRARRRRAPVLAALGALVVLAGCTTTTAGTGHGSAPSSEPDFPTPARTVTVTSTPTPSTSAVPSLADRDAELTAQTNGEPHVIVQVSGGYQAATYDQAGNIQFWANPEANTTWTQLGESSYPYFPSAGAPDVTLIGADLTGMSNATYIAHGYFTGDGSGDWLAFTAGAGNWGVVKALPNGNIGPSGQPVNPANQIGLSYHLAFVSGDLQTADCAPNVIIADCGHHEIIKLWRWAGTEFVRV